MQPPSSKVLKGIASACLLTVAAFEVSGLKFRELSPRWRALPLFAGLGPDEARAHGSGLAFDRAYGEFLESVRLAVPLNATVALDAPGSSQLYEYAAAYVLAPRRVVPISDLRNADFAAVFGAARVAPGSPVPAAAAIRFGSVGRLR